MKPINILTCILAWFCLGILENTAYATNASVLTVSATILSKSNCKFDSKNSALSFGAISPDSNNTVTATTTTGFICHGAAPQATFLIEQNGGLHSTTPTQNRMKHLTKPGKYLPYTLQLSNASATVTKNTAQTLIITGILASNDFQNSVSGSFEDTVILSINP
jgi:hypothetical protein